jgi:putative ABC transport system permease protein
MLLLIFTLSLAVFTASMAETLDKYTVDRSYYEVGADYRLIEMGESTQAVGGMGGAPAEGGSQNDQEDAGPLWLFLPVSEHEKVPGVEHAARVWERAIRVQLGGGQRVDATLLGIDRVDFPRASYYRRDFAPASLGALMNALAVRDDAVLISREVLNQGLEVGDKIQILIPVGSAPEVDFTVAGVVDLFPRLYPEDGPFFIANLDFIYNSVGGVYPYDVWLKVDPSIDGQTLLEGVKELGIDVLRATSARERIDGEQLKPERQGVFGLLSVGFVSSAFLTVLGFLIYSYVSFLQRYIELGVLRAIGLSVRQMALFLIVEQLSLVLTGMVAGTALGVLVSRLFIPFFQVRGGQHPFTPPFVVLVAWTEIQYIYAIFGVMFVAAVIVLLFSLRRMRIFEAVKLGETT